MRILALGFVLLLGAAGNGGGCSNPNAIGVQQYGSVVGRVLDASNNQPVADALVSVGSLYTGTTDPQGGFTLSGIPAGRQSVAATAPGYRRASVSTRVLPNKTSSVGYLRIAPAAGGPTIPPPPTPTPTPGPPTPVPVLPASPAPGGSAAP